MVSLLIFFLIQNLENDKFFDFNWSHFISKFTKQTTQKWEETITSPQVILLKLFQKPRYTKIIKLFFLCCQCSNTTLAVLLGDTILKITCTGGFYCCHFRFRCAADGPYVVASLVDRSFCCHDLELVVAAGNFVLVDGSFADTYMAVDGVMERE